VKRRWYILVLLLLFLTACGREQSEIAVDAPYALEIEYGDSGVQAMTGAHYWTWRTDDGKTTGSKAESLEPMSVLSEIPFVNESQDKTLKLLFAVEPDEVKITRWSSADGYAEATPVEKPKLKLSAPEDGNSHLFAVEARWKGTEKAKAWGSCTYYFRYLPEHATGDQSQEMSLYQMVQLEPQELFGVVVVNNLDGEQKTCTNLADRTAVLEYLKTYLSTNFVQIPATEAAADYVLRLAVIDGSQLTLSYGGEGKNAWIMLGGVPYNAEVMDLYSLWEQLETEAVKLEDETDSQYLQVSNVFPGEAWGENFDYGYLRSLDTEVMYDEILWIEDAEQPNGYALKRGTLGIQLPLAEDCEYWILKGHAEPWCQVEQELLWQWAETTGWDVLFRLYTKDGQVVAVCEQYLP